ncbi:MAG: SRPBCC family protein [Nitrosopumilus sp.]
MEIKKEITIDASPARVYQAITNPEELTKWFPDVASIEPKIGGKISFKFSGFSTDTHTNKERIMEGKIIELEKDRKLAYTWEHPDIPEFPLTRVSWILEEEKETNSTKVTITHDGFLDELMMKSQNDQWDWLAERLNVFAGSKKQSNTNNSKTRKGFLSPFSDFFAGSSFGDKTKPAKRGRKVNVTLQMILTCIPFVDIWTFYRIKKLRRYLTILVPVVLGVGLLIPLVAIGPEYYDNAEWRACVAQNGLDYCFENVGMYGGEPCTPDWKWFLYYNTCDPDEIRDPYLIFHISVLVMAVYLVRRWSRQWNSGTLQDVKA